MSRNLRFGFFPMWDLLFRTPILNILFLFYRLLFSNMGLAVIGLTLAVRGILIPLTLPAMRSSSKMKELQPQLNGIKEKHKGDKSKQAKAQLELYREHGVNPAGGCLPILLSIPVMIALYQVLVMALDPANADIISQKLYFNFLRTIDLSHLHTGFLWLNLVRADRFYVLPILTGVAQYLNAALLSPSTAKPKVESDNQEGTKEDMGEMAQAMQTQFKYIFPLMSVAVTARLPAGVALYWLVSTVFGIIQQKLLT